jgi:hypothetical protein
MYRRAPYTHARPLAVRSNVNGSGVDEGEGGCSAAETLCVTDALCEVTGVVSWLAVPLTVAATGPLDTSATAGVASAWSVATTAFCPPAAATAAARTAGVPLPAFDAGCVAVSPVEVGTAVEVATEVESSAVVPIVTAEGAAVAAA